MTLVLVVFACYGLVFGLGRLLFPRFESISASDCSHQLRRPYEPESSFGDESDYRSRCCRCGNVLRWEPNA